MQLAKPLSIILLLAFIASSANGQDHKNDSEKKVGEKVERIVVPAEGVKEFTVTGRSTLFRIAVFTPSGGTISDPVISGTARLIQTAEITEVGEGGEPSIGSLRKEFVFRGTGAGKARIEIRKTVPTAPMPVMEVYNVTIK